VHIFPHPQSMDRPTGTAVLADGGTLACSLVLTGGASPLEEAAAELLAGEILERTGQRPPIAGAPRAGIAIYVGATAGSTCPSADGAAVPDGPEAYRLVVTPDEIALIGNEPAGTFYAPQTLVQMLRAQEGRLVVDAATINDWPDFRHRGLYIESK